MPGAGHTERNQTRLEEGGQSIGHLYVWVLSSGPVLLPSSPSTILDSVPQSAFNIELAAFERSWWMTWCQRPYAGLPRGGRGATLYA
jgi:hypothetical protein